MPGFRGGGILSSPSSRSTVAATGLAVTCSAWYGIVLPRLCRPGIGVPPFIPVCTSRLRSEGNQLILAAHPHACRVRRVQRHGRDPRTGACRCVALQGPEDGIVRRCGITTHTEEVAPEALGCRAGDTQDGIGRRGHVLGASRSVLTSSHGCSPCQMFICPGYTIVNSAWVPSLPMQRTDYQDVIVQALYPGLMPFLYTASYGVLEIIRQRPTW